MLSTEYHSLKVYTPRTAFSAKKTVHAFSLNDVLKIIPSQVGLQLAHKQDQYALPPPSLCVCVSFLHLSRKQRKELKVVLVWNVFPISYTKDLARLSEFSEITTQVSNLTSSTSFGCGNSFLSVYFYHGINNILNSTSDWNELVL